MIKWCPCAYKKKRKIGKCLINSASTEEAYCAKMAATMWKSSNPISTTKRNDGKLYCYREGGVIMTNSCLTLIIQLPNVYVQLQLSVSFLLIRVVKINFTACHKHHASSAQSGFFSLDKALAQLTDWLHTTWSHCYIVDNPCVPIAYGSVLIKATTMLTLWNIKLTAQAFG